MGEQQAITERRALNSERNQKLREASEDPPARNELAEKLKRRRDRLEEPKPPPGAPRQGSPHKLENDFFEQPGSVDVEQASDQEDSAANCADPGWLTNPYWARATSSRHPEPGCLTLLLGQWIWVQFIGEGENTGWSYGTDETGKEAGWFPTMMVAAEDSPGAESALSAPGVAKNAPVEGVTEVKHANETVSQVQKQETVTKTSQKVPRSKGFCRFFCCTGSMPSED